MRCSAGPPFYNVRFMDPMNANLPELAQSAEYIRMIPPEMIFSIYRSASIFPDQTFDRGTGILMTRELTCGHCCQFLFSSGLGTLHRCSIEHTQIITDTGELLYESGD